MSALRRSSATRSSRPSGAVATSVGRRNNQEDAGQFWALARGRVMVAAVADGMGGHQGGEVASAIAIEELNRELKRHGDGSVSPQDLFRTASAKANQRILKEAPEDAGTTLVAAFVTDNYAVFAHAGDSRAYLVTADDVIQVTRDHSAVQDAIDRGIATSEDAMTSRYRHAVLRYLGDPEFPGVEVHPERLYREIPKNSVILLCSDGLYGFLEPHEIASWLKGTRTLEEGCEALVRAAYQNGSDDNITVAAIEVGRLERDHRPRDLPPPIPSHENKERRRAGKGSRVLSASVLIPLLVALGAVGAGIGLVSWKLFFSETLAGERPVRQASSATRASPQAGGSAPASPNGGEEQRPVTGGTSNTPSGSELERTSPGGTGSSKASAGGSPGGKTRRTTKGPAPSERAPQETGGQGIRRASSNTVTNKQPLTGGTDGLFGGALPAGQTTGGQSNLPSQSQSVVSKAPKKDDNQSGSPQRGASAASNTGPAQVTAEQKTGKEGLPADPAAEEGTSPTTTGSARETTAGNPPDQEGGGGSETSEQVLPPPAGTQSGGGGKSVPDKVPQNGSTPVQEPMQSGDTAPGTIGTITFTCSEKVKELLGKIADCPQLNLLMEREPTGKAKAKVVSFPGCDKRIYIGKTDKIRFFLYSTADNREIERSKEWKVENLIGPREWKKELSVSLATLFDQSSFLSKPFRVKLENEIEEHCGQ